MSDTDTDTAWEIAPDLLATAHRIFHTVMVKDLELAIAAALAAVREAERAWQPIETAPRDGTGFWAYSQDMKGSGLPPFQSSCCWHPDAGFCTDEIREPTHWRPLPAPPTIRQGGPDA